MKDEEAYLAQVSRRGMSDLQPKFWNCSRNGIRQQSLKGSPFCALHHLVLRGLWYWPFRLRREE